MKFSKFKIFGYVLGGVGLLYLSSLVWLGFLIRETWIGSYGAAGFQTIDAVIVLGARVHYNNQWNPCLFARVEHGAELMKNYGVRFLIVSGGTDIEDGANEASAMREMALRFGISSEQIILEPKATSTFENLKFSKVILQARKLKTVIVVTEKFHSPRAALIAKKLGLDFYSSPAPESACWSRWKYLSRFFLREPFAVLENWLRGNL